MADEKTDESQQKSSSGDYLKKKIVEYLFHLCGMATTKETEISNFTYETGFVRGVNLAKSLMWKHMLPPVQEKIKKIYTDMDSEIRSITTTLDDSQKKLEKQYISDNASMQVLQILLTVLLYSSMSVEMKEIEIKDWDMLITKTRQNEPIKLFENVINEKEEP